MRFKYIFIILVYKNVDDLQECIDSIKKKVTSFKIIVVNSFFDNKTETEIKKVAEDNDCAFISVENKGYGYGNNRGLEYAIANFEFDYAIISNPDIIVQKFDDSKLTTEFPYEIIAPDIIARSGKKQNPMAIYNCRLTDKLEYMGLKFNRTLLFYLGVAINKITRLFFLFVYCLLNKSCYPIFAAHGSFVIISRQALIKMFPLYDENVFLFGEEGMLAYKAVQNGVKTCYLQDIVIRHKEDGSMKLSNISVSEELKKSNIYYYEKYVIRK